MKEGTLWLSHIDGAFVPATDGRTLAVDDPATTDVVGHVALAGREDVDRAVPPPAGRSPAGPSTR